MYYQHSGRFSAGGVLLALAAGIGSGFVLSYAYGSWLNLIPEAHFAAFATIAFGALVGVATGLGLVWGHIRNKKVALAVAAITTVSAHYISWGFWIRSIVERSAHKTISWSALVEHPHAIWLFMRYINQYGTWTIDNGTPTTGAALWAIWTLEAALVIGIGVLAAYGIVQKRPYCETCGQWCRQTARMVLAPVQDLLQLKQELENKDLRTIAALGPGGKVADHLQLELQSCNSCNQFHTLTASQVFVRRKKLGQPAVSQKTIARKLIVGPSEAQAIQNLAQGNARNSKVPTQKSQGAAAGAR